MTRLAHITGAKHLSPARASLLINTELLLAPLWTWAFLNEQPAVRTLLGGALVLLALAWLVTHPPSREASPKLLDHRGAIAAILGKSAATRGHEGEERIEDAPSGASRHVAAACTTTRGAASTDASEA